MKNYLENLIEGSENGIDDAIYELAVYYYENGKPDRSIELFEQLSKKDHGGSQYHLSEIYNEIGSIQKSIEYSEKAAKNGIKEALNFCSYFYINEVEQAEEPQGKNLQKAIKYTRDYLNYNNDAAKSLAFAKLLTVENEKENKNKIRYWLNKSANEGIIDSKKLLDEFNQKYNKKRKRII